MIFKIPFTLAGIEPLKTKSKIFFRRIKHKKTKLSENLKNSDVDLTREEYLAICIRSFVIYFITLFLLSTPIFILLKLKLFVIFSLLFSFLFSTFIFFSQIMYPSIYINKRQRAIEKNLIPAMEDMLVQLNSGIPLFWVITNISYSDYGELSNEFKKAVKRISSGESEEKAFDDLSKNNPSMFFKRTLWQISNGIKSGSDMSMIIEDSIKLLNKEQQIQIQDYGNRLNPIIMFYMMIAIIIPALSITFITILSSMIGLNKTITMLIFAGLFVLNLLIQIMFIGIIRSKRPNLL